MKYIVQLSGLYLVGLEHAAKYAKVNGGAHMIYTKKDAWINAHWETCLLTKIINLPLILN